MSDTLPSPADHRKLSAREKRELLASLLQQRAAAPASALSHGQKALWLLHQSAPHSAAYNTAFAVRVRSAVQAASLRSALQALTARHAVLRTTFRAVDGVPLASVQPQAEAALTLVDARGWSDAALHAQVAADYRQPFDLERGPLLRTSLYSRAGDDHVLLLALHHIVCDAWSIWMLVHELGLLYEAAVAGRDAALAPLPAQFADHVAWQRRVLDGPEGEQLWRYWRDTLAGELPALDLPFARPRPAEPGRGGASHFFEIDAALTRRLLQVGQAQGATLFMVLLAAFQALLHRCSGQDEVIVGSPAAGRNHPDSAAAVGYFANPLPLRTRFGDDPSFDVLLSRVRHTVLDALAHQDLPFALLVERLRPPRQPGRWPVFDVLFVLQRPPQSEAFAELLSGQGPARLGGLEVEPFALAQMEGQFDLTLEVFEGRDGLRGVFKYAPELFDADAMRRMEGHLRTLLQAVAEDPCRPVSRLPLLTAAEREQVLHAWQGARRDYPLQRCLHHWIEDQARRSPEAVAVRMAEQMATESAAQGPSLTYRELDRRANRLAHRLQRLGAGPGEVVAVLSERSLELMVALLAVLKAGAAYLPLEPQLPAQRLARMVQDAQARVLLAQGAPAAALPAVAQAAAHVIGLDGVLDGEGDGEGEGPAVALGPDDLAYVIYTSGSTGEPKGVENTHRGICNRLLWMQEAYGLTAADRVLQKTPMGFDVSVWEFFWPLMAGATLVMAAPQAHRDRDALVDTIVRCGITTLHFVPSMLHLFLQAPGVGRCRAALRRVFCSGEALPLELQQRAFERLDVELHNLYGPTEAAVDVTFWRCRRDTALHTVPIGRPIANTRVLLLDRHGQPVPVGVPGELHIGGVAVARGYRNRPGLTAEKFITDPFSAEAGARLYRTGDLCRWLADGNVEYLHRMDTQVKLRGQRIELGEVEAVLGAHPQVAHAVATVEGQGGDAQLLAWYVPQPGTTPDAAGLRRHLRERLTDAMVPAHLLPLAALPVTANGKLDRAALPRPAAARAVADADTASRTPAAPGAGVAGVEQRIAAIWARVLRLEAVDPAQNFFDLGGHSMLVPAVQTRLAEAFGRAPSLVEMFRLPTVRGLAGFYAAAQPQAPRAAQAAAAAMAAPQARGDIAIIGMAGRFPGAADVQAFWDNLCAGVESIRGFDDAALAAAGESSALMADPRYVRAFGALDGIEGFDAEFFGVTPREAELMDVQHRLLLECAWSALESAGHDPRADAGRCGLFAGVGMNRYLLRHLLPQPAIAAPADASDLYRLMMGNDKDFAPSRAAYKLGLTGPGVSVQTACSTSLVAVHLACRSLLGGDCDTALAGGCSVTLPQDRGYLHQEGMILSRDGHCRTFDAEASGTVGGNGVAFVVLKRLQDALADGDHVHAVIKGSAINNDGAAKAGYTAPGLDGQAAVIAAALRAAGVPPASLGYVEAHGTGTPVGDPIEVAALTRAFRDVAGAAGDAAAGDGAAPAAATGWCALGSVKSNVGHLDTAAGVTGLIKAALAVEHALVPPTLHFGAPNPALELPATPFFVPAALQPWPGPAQQPRRAGVSSFGIGGTNAHVVLEQPPAPAPAGPARAVQPLLLSARTAQALDAAALRLAAHLRRHPALALADVAYTLACGRRAFEHRRALVCADVQQAVQALESGAHVAEGPVAKGPVAAAAPASVVFMFPGQGTQHAGMAAGLYRTEPVFAEQLDRCADTLRRVAGLDLHALLLDGGADAGARLCRTALAQPALFAVEYALARLWMSLGLQPQALIGHSLGEYVAACLAGVWSLEDALALVALRGELMQRQAAGAMLSVTLDAAEMGPWLAGGELVLAAVNAPGFCVAAGPRPDVEALAQRLAAAGVGSRLLQTSHAFHSPLMAPAAQALRARLRAMPCHAPAIPFVSNLTGTWIEPAQATDPDYWAQHLLQPVRFADGLDTLLAGGARWLVEVGPGDALCTLARRQPRRQALRAAVASLPAAGRQAQAPQAHADTHADTAALVEAAARLWTAGAPLDWAAFHGPRRRRVPLPTYPFQRRRHWIDAPRDGAAALAPALAAAGGAESLFHVPAWRRTRATPAAPAAGQHWLLLQDDCGLGTALAARLHALGVHVTRVQAAAGFERLAADAFAVRAGERADHAQVLAALRADGLAPPQVVLHLWNVTAQPADALQAQARERGFHSLLALAQALGEAADAAPCHLAVVSNGLHDVAGEGGLDAAKALLLGPVTVIPQEYARLHCSSLDIELAAPRLPRHVELLLADAAAGGHAQPVAYRGGRRWVLGLERLPLPQPAAPLPRAGGAYLVTGGSGGVGLAIAQWLAEVAPGVRLALLSRGEPAAADVERLRRAGAQVLCVRADVADAQSLHAALAAVRARFGALQGVVHAAGLADGRVIALAGRGHAQDLFAAKVDGTLHLAALLRGEPLEFFALCSSLTALLGGAGQCAYTAACAFQDAWAQQASAAGAELGQVVSIGWDRWEETGMARGAQARFAALTGAALAPGLSPAQATAALGRVLAPAAAGEARILVTPRDPAAERERSWGFQLGAQPPRAPGGEAPAAPARPQALGELVAPAGETEIAIAQLWREELGMEGLGACDDFFALGGDSLMAIRLAARLRQALQLPLDARVLYEAPSIRALALQVAALRWAAQAGRETAAHEEEGSL